MSLRVACRRNQLQGSQPDDRELQGRTLMAGDRAEWHRVVEDAVVLQAE
jgi:hypothetical protein